MARGDDELEPINRGINLNIRGGGGLGGVASVVVPIAVLGVIGIGGYILWRKFNEDCTAYDKAVGRTVTCTKNEDCPQSGGVNYICKPCGLFSSTRKCVACESTAATIANAFTGFGTLDSLSCMQQAGAATKPGTVPGPAPGASGTPLKVLPAGTTIVDITNPQNAVYQADCPSVIKDAESGYATTNGTSLLMTKQRNISQASGATFLRVACSPTTINGAYTYRAVAVWRVPNGKEIQTEIGETPLDYATRSNISLSTWGLAPSNPLCSSSIGIQFPFLFGCGKA